MSNFTQKKKRIEAKKKMVKKMKSIVQSKGKCCVW